MDPQHELSYDGLSVESVNGGFRATWYEHKVTPEAVEELVRRKLNEGYAQWERDFWDKVFYGEDGGGTREVLNRRAGVEPVFRIDGDAIEWLTDGWNRFYRRMERAQARNGSHHGSLAVSRAIHCGCGRVELHRDGRDDQVLAQLLMEGLRASRRS